MFNFKGSQTGELDGYSQQEGKEVPVLETWLGLRLSALPPPPAWS